MLVDPRVDLRTKFPDFGIPVFQTAFEVKTTIHNSLAENNVMFWFDPTLNTSPKPPLQKKYCHVGIHVILGI